MKVSSKAVVEVHFTLKNERGELIVSTLDSDPFAYLHGAEDVIEGLEDALQDLEVGSEFEAVIPPEKGYGLVDDRKIMEVPLDNFPEDAEMKVGEMLYAESEEGPQPVYIKEMRENSAVIDGNHELAGMTLHYKGEVLSIREATAQELKHGTVGSSCCSGGTCSLEE